MLAQGATPTKGIIGSKKVKGVLDPVRYAPIRCVIRIFLGLLILWLKSQMNICS
jgi:hypothetical protein